MAYPDTAEMAFSTPESVRTEPLHMTSEADTFMRVWWAMQSVPLGTRVDRDDWALITGECADAAESRYLARLAEF